MEAEKETEKEYVPRRKTKRVLCPEKSMKKVKGDKNYVKCWELTTGFNNMEVTRT